MLIKVNLVFLVIFLLEMVIKLMAYGLREYFNDWLNIFDCSLVLLSLVDVGLGFSSINFGNTYVL